MSHNSPKMARESNQSLANLKNADRGREREREREVRLLSSLNAKVDLCDSEPNQTNRSLSCWQFGKALTETRAVLDCS